VAADRRRRRREYVVVLQRVRRVHLWRKLRASRYHQCACRHA
jgi:hypothetical protein